MSLLGSCISTRKKTEIQLARRLAFRNKCTIHDGQLTSNKQRNMFSYGVFEMQALESCLSCMELDQSSMQHNEFFI